MTLNLSESSKKLYQRAKAKKITGLKLEDDVLYFQFEDGYKIRIFDDNQQCCESRYMHTDDDLSWFIGTKLVDIEIRDAPPSILEEEDDEEDCHEIQFLLVNTTIGTFTMDSHNIHNGYYGGFKIVVEEDEEDRDD